jgi:hypothetical protein
MVLMKKIDDGSGRKKKVLVVVIEKREEEAKAGKARLNSKVGSAGSCEVASSDSGVS